MLRLVRAGDVDAEVLGLLLGQLGELDAERVEVQAGDLLVEVLGQRRSTPTRAYSSVLVNSSIWAIVWLVKELLITNDGWPVALPRFSRRPSDSTMIECAVGEGPLVHLRLDLGLADAGDRRQAGHVDLVVEVADVADDRLVLHACSCARR